MDPTASEPQPPKRRGKGKGKDAVASADPSGPPGAKDPDATASEPQPPQRRRSRVKGEGKDAVASADASGPAEQTGAKDSDATASEPQAPQRRRSRVKGKGRDESTDASGTGKAESEAAPPPQQRSRGSVTFEGKGRAPAGADAQVCETEAQPEAPQRRRSRVKGKGAEATETQASGGEAPGEIQPEKLKRRRSRQKGKGKGDEFPQGELSAGFLLDPDCQQVHREMQLKRAWRSYICMITDTAIIVESRGARAETYADFCAALPADAPRYGVVDFAYRTADDRPQEKLVFVFWTPDAASSKDKVLYAASKVPLLAAEKPKRTRLHEATLQGLFWAFSTNSSVLLSQRNT